MTSSRNHGKPSLRSNPIAFFIAIFFFAIAAGITVAPATAHARRARAGKVAKGQGGKAGKGRKGGIAGREGQKRVAVVPPDGAAQPVGVKIGAALKAHKIK